MWTTRLLILPSGPKSSVETTKCSLCVACVVCICGVYTCGMCVRVWRVCLVCVCVQGTDCCSSLPFIHTVEIIKFQTRGKSNRKVQCENCVTHRHTRAVFDRTRIHFTTASGSGCSRGTPLVTCLDEWGGTDRKVKSSSRWLGSVVLSWYAQVLVLLGWVGCKNILGWVRHRFFWVWLGHHILLGCIGRRFVARFASMCVCVWCVCV